MKIREVFPHIENTNQIYVTFIILYKLEDDDILKSKLVIYSYLLC